MLKSHKHFKNSYYKSRLLKSTAFDDNLELWQKYYNFLYLQKAHNPYFQAQVEVGIRVWVCKPILLWFGEVSKEMPIELNPLDSPQTIGINAQVSNVKSFFLNFLNLFPRYWPRYSFFQLCSEACIISCVIIPTILLVIRYSIEKCHFVYLFVG